MGVDRPCEGDDEPESPEKPGSRGRDAPIPVADHDLPDRAAYFAEYKKAVEAEYRRYAIDQGCDRARETEGATVTPAMRQVEGQDPDRHLVGLEFRLKGRERIEEKVVHDMQKRGVSAEQAFGSLKDAIRYTFQYPDDRYSSGVRADVQRIKAEGFELVDFRNSWANEEYKGINSRWQVPENGQTFEVQFHTEASFAAKQETHTAYERLRTLPPDHEEVRELRAYQREISAKISIPPQAQDLTDR